MPVEISQSSAELVNKSPYLPGRQLNYYGALAWPIRALH